MTDVESPRSAAKRDQIRRGARALLLARGFAATSMDAVAAEAGVSKQTLYAYYPGKDALVGDVLHDLAVDGRGTSGVGDRAPGTREELVDLALRLRDVRTGPEQLALVRLVVAEAPRYPQLAEMFRAAVVDEGRQVVADAVGRLVPESAPADRAAAARALTAFLFTSSVFERLLGSQAPGPSRAEVEAVVDLLLAGTAERRVATGSGDAAGGAPPPATHHDATHHEGSRG